MDFQRSNDPPDIARSNLFSGLSIDIAQPLVERLCRFTRERLTKLRILRHRRHLPTLQQRPHMLPAAPDRNRPPPSRADIRNRRSRRLQIRPPANTAPSAQRCRCTSEESPPASPESVWPYRYPDPGRSDASQSTRSRRRAVAQSASPSRTCPKRSARRPRSAARYSELSAMACVIARKASACKDAPPTSAPSMSD